MREVLARAEHSLGQSIPRKPNNLLPVSLCSQKHARRALSPYPVPRTVYPRRDSPSLDLDGGHAVVRVVGDEVGQDTFLESLEALWRAEVVTDQVWLVQARPASSISLWLRLSKASIVALLDGINRDQAPSHGNAKPVSPSEQGSALFIRLLPTNSHLYFSPRS